MFDDADQDHLAALTQSVALMNQITQFQAAGGDAAVLHQVLGSAMQLALSGQAQTQSRTPEAAADPPEKKDKKDKERKPRKDPE